ncbi:MAG TPA: DNA glycosylase [Opitutus sp.]|nr:DNA glycosylase [Opitutus sp.]
MRLNAAVLSETLDGGQAFRWRRDSEGTWHGVFDRHAVRLRLESEGMLHWSAPAQLAENTGHALIRYLDTGPGLDQLVDALPWRSDPHLARCLAAFPGLRILRQPFGETLLGFLCSATKQIVQIKQMIALLAERHGASLLQSPEGDVSYSTIVAATDQAAPVLFRLPTWTELAAVPESELRACLLGFRARYIHQTAQFIAAHPGWLEETEQLPYAEAKERLCSLPGVGEKVADCVLLFGAGRLEAFPVDVWIIKAMAKRYALAGWKPAQIAHFGRTHFGAGAGLAQQYLFAWERRFGR